MKLETLPRAPAQPTASTQRWKKPLIGAVVLALAGGAYFAMQSRDKPADVKTAQAGGHGEKDGAPKVDVYELAKGDVAKVAAAELAVHLPLSGSLMPVAMATVKSKVSGVVLESTLREGSSVKAGQVLAQLDSADQRARLAQQQAALDEARARLALATKNNANSQALLKQNYISQQSYDSTQNSVELAQASVKAAQAVVDLARIALNDTVIKAPLAGVISKRHVQAGEKLSPDMPVYTIVNLQQLNLEAQVPASEIPRIKVGQEVQFKVDGYQGRQFSGKVARINPTTEMGSRSMLVYITVDNSDSALSGGMFAKGTITTQKSALMPLVPLAALRRENNSDVVFAIEGGKVVAKPVQLGLRNEDDGLVEVSSGVASGATVIVSKLEGVKPGSKVKVMEAPTAVAQPSLAPATKG